MRKVGVFAVVLLIVQMAASSRRVRTVGPQREAARQLEFSLTVNPSPRHYSRPAVLTPLALRAQTLYRHGQSERSSSIQVCRQLRHHLNYWGLRLSYADCPNHTTSWAQPHHGVRV